MKMRQKCVIFGCPGVTPRRFGPILFQFHCVNKFQRLNTKDTSGDTKVGSINSF